MSILLRTWWTWGSGWFVGDEALYINSMLESVRSRAFVYLIPRSHHIFMWHNAVVGRLLSLDSVFKAIPFFALQALFWNGACLIIFDALVGKMDVSDNARSLTVLSLAMVPTVLAMNSQYLTDAPSMAFALGSTYMLCRAVERRSWRSAMVSGGLIGVACLYREPFLLLLVLDFALLVYLAVRDRLPAGAAFFILIPIILLTPRAPFSTLPGAVIWQPTAADDRHTLFLTEDLLSGTLDFSGDLLSRLSVVFSVVWRGMVFGWLVILPIVVLGVAFTVLDWRVAVAKDSTKTILVLMLASFVSLVIVGWHVSPCPYNLTSSVSSISIRYAYMTFPLLLGATSLFRRVPVRPMKYVAVIGVLSLLTVPLFFTMLGATQSSEQVDRINTSYRAPYYRMYLLLSDMSGDIAVIPEPAARSLLYLDELDNVDVYRMDLNFTEFCDVADAYDRVFMFQTKWAHYRDVHDEFFPFMGQVVLNNTAFRVSAVWEDGESYLYELIR